MFWQSQPAQLYAQQKGTYDAFVAQAQANSQQVMPGGFLTSEGYRCYEVGTENEIVIPDDRENKEPKFVEGDTITVYGTYYGTEKMERLLTGEKVSVRQTTICITVV